MSSKKDKIQLPFLARHIILFLHEYDEEFSISGDFTEEYQERKRGRGRIKAWCWYWFQVLYLIPAFIKSFITLEIIMIKNYLKTAKRNLIKYKGYSFINITGLTIGIVCFSLISLYVLDELSYDRYHEKADQIYRVGVKAKIGTQKFEAVTACAPMSQALVREFPEVLASTRLKRFGFPVIRYKDKVFSEERWYYADPTIFDVFTIPFIDGDPKTALDKPHSVVITESTAKKYFGEENPIGKTLQADKKNDFLVTGVVKDVPKNSHVHYDFLVSFKTLKNINYQNWMGMNVYNTYSVLHKNTDPDEFEKKLQVLIKKYVGPQVKNVFGKSIAELTAKGSYFSYFIQALTDIHLHSNYLFEHEPNSNITYVYVFSIIAILILLSAGINFMNLATARSARRAREVGVRKAIGANRTQLIRQFILESVQMSTIAVILAIPIIESLLPFFNNFTGKNLSIPYFTNIYTIPVFVGIALLTGILSGIYPAFFMASFRPAAVLKGEHEGAGKKLRLRSVLVVSQFTVSVILITGTIVVQKQLHFTQDKNLGFDREQVLIIHKTDDLQSQLGAFKHELLKNPAVSSVSNSDTLIGEIFSDDIYRQAGQPKEENQSLRIYRVDPHFIGTYKIKMVQGDFFPRDYQGYRRGIVLNESAVKILKLSNPLNQKILDMDGNEYRVIGVVKDFHFESLQHKIKPLAFHSLGPQNAARYLSIRMAAANIRDTISQIKGTWDKIAGGQAFEYEFFDDHFAKVYLSEKRTGEIVLIFSILAVIIACLGLFGLTSFFSEQRTKEMGIRKVLGASVTGIIFLLIKQFSRWVLLANLFAWPVAYFVLNRWLENFAYRTNLALWIFIFSGVISLIITLLTVSYQAIKTATLNPVNTLKYE